MGTIMLTKFKKLTKDIFKKTLTPEQIKMSQLLDCGERSEAMRLISSGYTPSVQQFDWLLGGAVTEKDTTAINLLAAREPEFTKRFVRQVCYEETYRCTGASIPTLFRTPSVLALFNKAELDGFVEQNKKISTKCLDALSGVEVVQNKELLLSLLTPGQLNYKDELGQTLRDNIMRRI